MTRGGGGVCAGLARSRQVALELPLDLAAGTVFGLAFDSDQNTSTGAPDGTDYKLEIVGGSSYRFELMRWNRSSFAVVPSPTTLVTYGAGVARFLLNKADI